jgi:hypothetical protein
VNRDVAENSVALILTESERLWARKKLKISLFYLLAIV